MKLFNPRFNVDFKLIIFFFSTRAHRLLTSTKEFAKKYNLGDPEFGKFFKLNMMNMSMYFNQKLQMEFWNILQ